MRVSLRRTVVVAVSLLAGVVVALSTTAVGPNAHVGTHTSTQYVAGGLGPHQ